MTTDTPSIYLPGSLQGHFLISMPHMDDPNFAQTVIYICEHNESGAMGIVVNRPIEMDLGQLLQHLEFSYNSDLTDLIYAGGPVP